MGRIVGTFVKFQLQCVDYVLVFIILYTAQVCALWIYLIYIIQTF